MPSAGSIRFVTGVDHRQFDQLFLLMGSMLRYCPAVTLWVCDFGLTGQQCDLLRRKGVLLEMPARLRRPPHAWYYKAALGRYVRGFSGDPVLWIDVDMIVLCDIVPLIERLNAGMAMDGDVLAAASNETVGEQIGVDPAPRYAGMVAGLDPDTRYLNSGFFLCRSADFLQRWDDLCATMPVEKLFEQNAFNLATLAAAGGVRAIDMLTWNMCGQHVRAAIITESGADIVVSGSHGRTHVLHATSNSRGGEVGERRLRLTINTTVFRLAMKMFARPEALLVFQRELILDALAANYRLLTECGFGMEA